MTIRLAYLALALAFLALGPTAWAADEFPAPAPKAADKAPADEAPADEAPAEDAAADAAAGGETDLAVIEDASTGESMRVDIVGIRSIIGPEPAKALRTVPGSSFTIDRDRLQKSRTVTTLQGALRGEPGVNVRPEASGGIVPNIGFRGLNPDRSERVLILEDGVPVGFAPYTVNAAYYVPPLERIARIEVLKGSGQILYGPHTVGAVMNLITPEIPEQAYARINLLAGSHGYIAPYLEAGATYGRWGFLVTGLIKQGDGYRDDSSFDVKDAMVKVRYRWSRRTDLTVKLTAHDSDSQNTYLGLTEGMFAQNPTQNPVPDDTYKLAYYGGTATFRSTRANHEWLVNLYTSYGMRDWNRQDFRRNTGFAAPPANTVATVGDTTIDGGAIYLRSSFGSRDRNFFKAGLEPRFRGTTWIGGRKNEYEVGARIHTEYFENERNNRPTLAGPVTTRDRDVTRTNAVSAWVHDKAQVTRRLSVSGGVRVE
ncbi:MAG: TonB-dependent receptor plug domain-containing protein, partial [Planctomycetota bacterium]|nr:TonB-dependent receptor plug domain-containing protein [Planctomycetota bacterium]